MLDDAVKFAQDTLAGFKKKANHNKNESLTCFMMVVVCSLVSPLFVTLGEGLLWGKIVPSVLSLTAAGSTAWLQLRKPQNLWSLYRDCQRRIEDHVYKFWYRLEEYDKDDEARARLLADAVRKIAFEAHERWLPLVPTPEALGGVAKAHASQQIENEPKN